MLREGQALCSLQTRALTWITFARLVQSEAAQLRLGAVSALAEQAQAPPPPPPRPRQRGHAPKAGLSEPSDSELRATGSDAMTGFFFFTLLLVIHRCTLPIPKSLYLLPSPSAFVAAILNYCSQFVLGSGLRKRSTLIIQPLQSHRSWVLPQQGAWRPACRCACAEEWRVLEIAEAHGVSSARWSSE